MADNNKDMTQGALFISNRRSKDNHPNYRGEITISKALLRELVERAKQGGEIKIALAAWQKKSKAGNQYLSVAGQLWVNYQKQQDESGSFSDNEDIPF